MVRIPADTFADYYGDSIDGKSYLGMVIAPVGGALTNLAPSASLTNAADFVAALTDLSTLASSRPIPAPAAALTEPEALAAQVAGQVRPMVRCRTCSPRCSVAVEHSSRGSPTAAACSR